MNMAKDMDLWLDFLHEFQESFASPSLLFVYLIQDSIRRPMSDQNIYFIFVFFYEKRSLFYGEIKHPIKVIAAFVDTKYSHSFDFDQVLFQKMANTFEYLPLFLNLLVGICIFRALRIEDDVVIARNYDFMFVRKLLDELSKAIQFLFCGIHRKISSVNEEISLRKFVYLDLIVHVMSIRQCNDFPLSLRHSRFCQLQLSKYTQKKYSINSLTELTKYLIYFNQLNSKPLIIWQINLSNYMNQLFISQNQNPQQSYECILNALFYKVFLSFCSSGNLFKQQKLLIQKLLFEFI